MSLSNGGVDGDDNDNDLVPVTEMCSMYGRATAINDAFSIFTYRERTNIVPIGITRWRRRCDYENLFLKLIIIMLIKVHN